MMPRTFEALRGWVVKIETRQKGSFSDISVESNSTLEVIRKYGYLHTLDTPAGSQDHEGRNCSPSDQPSGLRWGYSFSFTRSIELPMVVFEATRAFMTLLEENKLDKAIRNNLAGLGYGE
jgi:hypothetical protein